MRSQGNHCPPCGYSWGSTAPQIAIVAEERTVSHARPGFVVAFLRRLARIPLPPTNRPHDSSVVPGMPAITAKFRGVVTLLALVLLGGVLAAENAAGARDTDEACCCCGYACGGGCGDNCTCRSRDRSPAAPYELPQQPRRIVDVPLPRGTMPAAWADDVSPREARSFDPAAFDIGPATLVAQHVRLQI